MNVYHMTSKNAVKFRTKYEILHIYFISLSDFLWLYYSWYHTLLITFPNECLPYDK